MYPIKIGKLQIRGAMDVKNTILHIISIILGIVAVVAIGLILAVNHGDGGGFLDLSTLARMIYGGVAILFASLSVVTWKIDNKATRKTKVIVWAAIVAIIIILIVTCSLYRVPAVEIIN